MVEPQPDRNFFAQLVACDDRRADSLVFGGLALIAALIVFTGWDVIAHKHDFEPITFATAAGLLLGAVGGSKVVRDRFKTPQDAPAPAQETKP